ncbi:hypothetical protein CEUSTIGMA_g3197.t1 [Chlamydomonas eustigma]|uniref:Nuclear pore complex protein Nup85 n=1 Tax=Chlamydomonas eustigma TaxID=1157962 RepID=A0A250WY33_9CHLO|nr:hypothetical protein CEUSTIGMA_g3197.t1 [Chlamydomonas eustigma]|eukprot:GAX75754.1 hypothetical protein CEUSTIGMA_g3197.t1 [Chlamydomonas eustigma]
MEDVTAPAIISARVPCSSVGTLTFSWGVGTEIRLFEVVSPESGLGGQEPFKSVVTWSAPSSSHKTLAHAVVSAQAQLHTSQPRDLQGSRTGAVPQQLISFSNKVLSALAKERQHAEGSLVSLEHAIWQLLGIFFINITLSGGYFAEDLSAWLADNGAIIDEMSGRASLQSRLEVLLNSARADVLADYWPCMCQLVSVGRMRDALKLMEAHDVMQGHLSGTHDTMMPQYELMDALYVLMRQMPRFKNGGASNGLTGREFDNMAEYLQYRSQWQLQCRQLPSQCETLFQGCQTVNAMTASGILSILAILGGDDEAALGTHSGNWLELLVSELIHMRPHAQARQHLRPLLRHCQDMVVQQQQQEPEEEPAVLPLLRDLLEALVDSEVQRVVEVLSSSGAVSPWFMTHMYEVMQAAPRTSEVIERPLPLFGGDQVEYWRLMFAEMLASQPSTSKLALSYLALCPTYGADAAETFIESIPIGQDSAGGPAQVHKLLHLCESHGLSSVSTSICRAAAAASMQHGQLGKAAGWALRARDSRMLAAILEPMVVEVEELLFDGVGKYQASVLPLRAVHELEELLNYLSPLGIVGKEELQEQDCHNGINNAEAPRKSQSTSGSSSLEFLCGLLNIEKAIQSYQDTAQQIKALEPMQMSSDNVDAQHSSSMKAVRSSVLTLLGSDSVPWRLLLPILFHIIPFLESSSLCFSAQDVRKLMRLLTDLTFAEKSGSFQSCMHDRHIKDIRLALSRALARSHVYGDSSSTRIAS